MQKVHKRLNEILKGWGPCYYVIVPHYDGKEVEFLKPARFGASSEPEGWWYMHPWGRDLLYSKDEVRIRVYTYPRPFIVRWKKGERIGYRLSRYFYYPRWKVFLRRIRAWWFWFRFFHCRFLLFWDFEKKGGED